jgi:hypothetical protein
VTTTLDRSAQTTPKFENRKPFFQKFFALNKILGKLKYALSLKFLVI